MSPPKGEDQVETFPSQIQELIDHNKHLAEADIVWTAQDRASWRRLRVDSSSVDR